MDSPHCLRLGSNLSFPTHRLHSLRLVTQTPLSTRLLICNMGTEAPLGENCHAALGYLAEHAPPILHPPPGPTLGKCLLRAGPQVWQVVPYRAPLILIKHSLCAPGALHVRTRLPFPTTLGGACCNYTHFTDEKSGTHSRVWRWGSEQFGDAAPCVP